MEQLIALYLRKLERTNTNFFRYLFDKIDWRNRLIVIKGAKGVGKTTLVMQHIKTAFENPLNALYLSLDHIWFSSHNLLEAAEYHYLHGGTHLFLDEVHKYPNWEQEVKNIYDFYPDMHIVVTGSSMLKLEESVKADLSRRHKMYHLSGLSFREFVNIETGSKLQAYTLEDIFQRHPLIASSITSSIKVIPLFEKYLRYGYYPFYLEEGSGFEERLLQVIDSVVTAEIPSMSNIEFSTTYKIKRFISALSCEEPFTLNVSMLCKSLEITRNNLFKILSLISSAGIVRSLYTKEGVSALGKPEKILFDNPNLLYAFDHDKIGTARESFFASQLSVNHSLLMPANGDFLIDNRYTIEVGGAKKGFTQIKDIPDSYVAADNIEIGAGAKIPLWLFGLLY